ncbi:MAG: tRNA pseudouridine(55) synthase TruB [Candidatus Limnocylindrales bacterium]
MTRSASDTITDLDGIVVVDKPAGPTSHDIVALIRRLSGVRRVGHGGTLDPFATGVLPVFIGRATRLVEYHMADEKAYRTLVAFGARSTTDDLDGELTPGEGPVPDRARVEAALDEFRGPIRQVPPDHSAVRVAGRHAYAVARAGEKPVLAARDVEILDLTLTGWQADDPERPTATLELRCTAGTYVRALARDLGERLGCGAYLVALTRTKSGPFQLAAAHEPDAIRRAFAEGEPEGMMMPSDTGLEAFPPLTLAADDLGGLLKGQVVRPRLADLEPGAARRFRVRDAGGRLAAIARLEGGRLHPEKVFLAPGE